LLFANISEQTQIVLRETIQNRLNDKKSDNNKLPTNLIPFIDWSSNIRTNNLSIKNLCCCLS